MKNNYVNEYQCPGCIYGGNECFKENEIGIGCKSHCTSTYIMGLGKIFLGLDHGFNRLGRLPETQLCIFENHEQQKSVWEYDYLNMPVWKYLNKNNHVIIRGMLPRINEPFIHVILENCIDKIECFEITDEHLKKID